jgi:uncharacterized membrane protein (Fun14 family)
MSSVKKALARKAVKSTAKHTAHGTASRLRRDPFRAATLLGVGCIAGLAAGWALGRTAASTAAVAGPS